MVDRPILPLSLSGVSVSKKGKAILENVSLDIGASGLTVVMGPNGAGKTTLLRLIHGLERPRSGTVDWNCPRAEARLHQAFVFQTPVMMRRSVLDNIMYPLRVRKVARAAALREAQTWVEEVGLASRSELDAEFLSGGERQKLAIVRALIVKPQLLFLDEPTTNLDGTSTREIETILLGAKSNGTRLIVATHDLGQAKRLATDVVFLNRGKVMEHSPAAQFFSRPETAEARAYLNGEIVE